MMIGPKTGTTHVNWTQRVKEEGLEKVCGTQFKKESIGFYFLLQSCIEADRSLQGMFSMVRLALKSGSAAIWYSLHGPVPPQTTFPRCAHPTDCLSSILHLSLVPLCHCQASNTGRAGVSALVGVHHDHSPANMPQSARGASQNRLRILLRPCTASPTNWPSGRLYLPMH